MILRPSNWPLHERSASFCLIRSLRRSSQSDALFGLVFQHKNKKKKKRRRRRREKQKQNEVGERGVKGSLITEESVRQTGVNVSKYNSARLKISAVQYQLLLFTVMYHAKARVKGKFNLRLKKIWRKTKLNESGR